MKKRHGTKLYKRVVSMAAAVAMLVTSMPVSELSYGARNLFNNIKAAAAAAEGYERYPISTDANTGNQSCTIGSFQNLIAYSESYKAYPDEYCSVDIVINFYQNTIENLNDFISIGTLDNPFSADIYFTATSTNGLILNKPLFNYVSESCHVYSWDEPTTDIPLRLTRVSGGSVSPLYANHVTHDETGSGNVLNIFSNDYLPQSVENIDLGEYSGVIGELQAGAQLELNFTNKSNKDITGSGDVGLLCGTMGKNSSLTAEISAESNSTNSVKSTGGNAGGLVGSMADGSSLTIKSNITTSGNISATSESGYAGGLVGYAENSVVNFPRVM